MAVVELPEQEWPEIPAQPPYIPLSPGAFSAPRERGPEYRLPTQSWQIPRRSPLRHSDLVEVTRTQYWRRVYVDWISCGDHTATASYTVRSGLTKEVATELSANLGFELGGIASVGVSGALKNRIETSENRERNVTQNFRAVKCARKLLTVWQVIDVFAVRRTKRWRMPREPKIGPLRTYELPTDVTDHRIAQWPDESCCPRNVELDPREELFVVTFPDGQLGVPGVATSEEQATLDGVEGQYTIGGTVPLTAFSEPQPWFEVPGGADVTFGLLTREQDAGAAMLNVGDEQLERFEATVDSLVAEGSRTELMAALNESEHAVDIVVGSLRESRPDLDPKTEYSLLTAIGAYVVGQLSVPAGL